MFLSFARPAEARLLYAAGFYLVMLVCFCVFLPREPGQQKIGNKPIKD